MRTVRFTADLVTPDPVICRYCTRVIEQLPYLTSSMGPTWSLPHDTYETECAYRKPDEYGLHPHEPLPSTGVYGDPVEDGHGETLESGWWNPRWSRYQVSQDPADGLVETYDEAEHQRTVEGRRGGNGYAYAGFPGTNFYHVLVCSCGNESKPLIGWDDAEDVLSDDIGMPCDPARWLAETIVEHCGTIDSPGSGGHSFYAADDQEDYRTGARSRPAAHAKGFTREEIAEAIKIMEGK